MVDEKKKSQFAGCLRQFAMVDEKKKSQFAGCLRQFAPLVFHEE